MPAETSKAPSEQVVFPRKKGFQRLPIVAVDERSGELLDETGEVTTLESFIELLPFSESCLIVTCQSAWVLALIQTQWERTTGWYSKATRRERAIYTGNVILKSGITVSVASVVPHYCGWRRGKCRNGRRNSYGGMFRLAFHFLDPDLFYASEKAVQDVFGIPRDMTTRKLLEWGIAVRQFCEENDLPINPTQGSLSAKFLTDPRFYPKPRRKVPKATNDRLRRYLPGNHSTVFVRTGGDRQFNGHYLDQRRAHHYHARTTRLPSANSLFAHGDFVRLKQVSLDPTAFLNGGFHGVVAGNFTPPKRGVTILPPGWRRRAISRRMVSTAEWPWLSDIGVECTGLYAAWGSTEADAGIPAYSVHAERELDRWVRRPSGAKWLKPILVSTYGALAVNVETTFDTLIGGHVPDDRAPESWPAGSEELHGYLMRHTRGASMEPGTVNVLHRLLIESATRTESLAFANHLTGLGYWVLMIHVDALIIEDGDRPLPMLFEPWQYKSYLTGLTFHDHCSFESLEMTRMPGRAHLRDRRMVAVRRPSIDFRNSYDSHLLPMVPEP